MNNGDRYERRHTYLINKELQGRFAAFVITILIGYSLILLIFQKLSKSIAFPLMIPIVFGVLIVFVGVVSLFYSHRVAGPLFALQRATKEIANGDLLIRLNMRKESNIAFHQIAENVNAIRENFRETVFKMEDKLIRLSKETEDISEKIKGNKNELVFHVNRLLEAEREMGDILKAFKIY